MSSKRSLSPDDSPESDPKRRRVAAQRAAAPQHAPSLTQDGKPAEHDAAPDESEAGPLESTAPTRRHVARCGIQRSIALVLKHVGFASASPEAMESFTLLVEQYLGSLIQETKRFALTARREHPIPTDFELALRYHNLTPFSLKPHLKNPIARHELAPTYVSLRLADADALATLPLLSQDLSGQAEKDAKQYIPSSFPDFPSQHTYRFTPQEDSGTRNSQKIREDSARTNQQGENALRGLVRASKMCKQKEVKSLVEWDAQGKERFRLWETTMKRFMGDNSRGENAGQVHISDHSMIVNADAAFSREVPRTRKRSAGLIGSLSSNTA